MNRWARMFTIALAIALGMGLCGASIVSAQAPTGQQVRGQALRIVTRALIGAAAKATKLDSAALRKELATGKSLAEVIKAHDADLAAVEAEAKATITTQINQAVSDKKITQDQANKALGQIDKVLDKLVNQKLPTSVDRRVRLIQATGLSILARETAKQTQLSQRDLLKELRSGKSLADIAKAHNTDPTKIVSAAIQTATDRINKMVSSGKLKQDQAKQLLAALPDAMNKFMNTPGPLANILRGTRNNSGSGTSAAPAATPQGTPGL